MRFKRGRQTGDVWKIQMAPMIDVVFQLLIFFLVTSEVKPTEADFMANLPAGSGPADRPVPAKEPYRVYLRGIAKGDVEIRLQGTLLGTAKSGGYGVLLERLKNIVNTLPSNKKDTMLLVIDGEPTVKLQHIASVLDQAVEAKVLSVTFGKPKTGS